MLNINPRGLLWDESFAFCGRSSDGGDEEALFFWVAVKELKLSYHNGYL